MHVYKKVWKLQYVKYLIGYSIEWVNPTSTQQEYKLYKYTVYWSTTLGQMCFIDFSEFYVKRSKKYTYTKMCMHKRRLSLIFRLT